MGITFVDRSSQSLKIKNSYGDIIDKTKVNHSVELLQVIEEDHNEEGLDEANEIVNSGRSSNDNIIEEYELLLEIPFDSDRKRMSTVLRNKKTRKIEIFTKGADTNVLPICKINNVEKSNIESITI